LFAVLLCLAVSYDVAQAQQSLVCQQLGPVAGSPLPAIGNGANVSLAVGDHYWSCPCGETRKLVGDNENRNLTGDNEQRRIVGDNENRALVGDNEQRRIVGDNEQRQLVGDAGGLQCRPEPQCGGFELIGANVAIQVVTRNGLQPAKASCVPAY
jgi:hypothetical protein